MTNNKRDRDSADAPSGDDDFFPSKDEQQPAKKHVGASPKKSPRKKKVDDGEAKDEKRSWTKEEDLVILKAVNDFVNTMQLDYSCILPGIQAVNGGHERTKTAVRMRWMKILKPHLLGITGQAKENQ